MPNERTVNAREFLRNFRSIRHQLDAGKFYVIRISLRDGKEYTLTSNRPAKTGADFLRAVRKIGRPIHIRRTHIFDELLRPRRRR